MPLAAGAVVTITVDGEGNTSTLTDILGTSGSDRLVGTDADERIVSGEGSYDRIFTGGGRDTIVIGAETNNGSRERDIIYDYDPVNDVILLEQANIVRAVTFATGALFQLDGDGDLIYVLGQGVSSEDVTFI